MTPETDVTRNGKGRVTPGPSSLRRSLVPLGSAALLAVGSAMQFIMAIEARRAFSAEVLAAIIAIAGAGALFVIGRSVDKGQKGSLGTRALAFAAGAAGLFGAPYLVLLHRYSDAPPGSEILFLTTAAWAVLLVLMTLRGASSDLMLAAGALLVLGGVAATVGNWERPSSFSPFVRYATEEYWMLAGGLAWAFMWWLLARSLKRGEASAVVVPLAAGGAGAALVAILVGDASFAPVTQGGSGLVLLLGASAVTASAGFVLLRQKGIGAVAGAHAMPAAVITSLTYLEQATGAFGPQPILLVPAAAGIVVALSGATLWWAGEGGVFLGPIAKRWTTLLAWASVAVAAIGLTMPALRGFATGLRAGGQSFEASFVLLGAEVVGAWLALGIALGAAALSTWRSAIEARALALLAAAAAWLLVAWTPLHTLTSFIPTEVQVDFGSEFASIRFERISIPLSYAAVLGAVTVVALSLAARFRKPTPVPDVSVEE